MPDKLLFDLSALGGPAAYLKALFKLLFSGQSFDLIYCAHVNLMPLARLAAKRFGAPLVLAIYGIEAWQPSPRWLARRASLRADHILSISRVTWERFKGWSGYRDTQLTLMPNAIHLEQFRAEPKNKELESRYGVIGKRVILTLGRLADKERYKGFDEVIDILPELLRARNDLVYMIAGDGEDGVRLKQKVAEMGLSDHVIFTGMVSESEKADIFGLADVFAMPSQGEGFGFVILEALASGVPCVGSTLDGTKEALRDGELGPLVDPLRPEQLKEAILSLLDRPRAIPDGLTYFAFPQFAARMSDMVDRLTAGH